MLHTGFTWVYEHVHRQLRCFGGTKDCLEAFEDAYLYFIQLEKVVVELCFLLVCRAECLGVATRRDIKVQGEHRDKRRIV